MNRRLLWLGLLMVVVFVLSRWPGLMPLNFSAGYAIVFCAGVYFPGPWGWIFPLGLLIGSDLLLNIAFYSKDGFSASDFLVNEWPVLLAYAVLVALGRWFGAKRSWGMLVGGGLLGAVLFYIVTNTAAWLNLPPYQKTLAGWIQAITVGLPGYPQTWEFFRNTLLSGGLFTGLFVGAMKATEAADAPETEEEEAEAPPAETGEPEPLKTEP